MKRPIKFRGQLESGKFVYGDLAHGIGEVFVDECLVKPESVTQLVGCDRDGREVYEGDIFIIANGTEIAAKLFDNITKTARLKED